MNQQPFHHAPGMAAVRLLVGRARRDLARRPAGRAKIGSSRCLAPVLAMPPAWLRASLLRNRSPALGDLLLSYTRPFVP